MLYQRSKKILMWSVCIFRLISWREGYHHNTNEIDHLAGEKMNMKTEAAEEEALVRNMRHREAVRYVLCLHDNLQRICVYGYGLLWLWFI